MPFVDEVVIRVCSGAGGNGCVSFRREKYVPRGGPNGGHGGKGGSVSFIPTRNKSSLLDFKYQPFFRARRGEHGKGKELDGRTGEACTIEIPVGTLIYDHPTGRLLHDATQEGLSVQIAKGGKGGRGNRAFCTPTRRAPRIAEPGEPGEELELRLELRLMADVGLIGLPNAGKSSLLRVISRATPKVADYPFTTLDPHLGVVSHKSQSFVVADLPGLIEGAASGTGLGFKFLRHASRNRTLLHLVDVSGDTDAIQKDINTIRSELKTYDPALAERPTLLIFTKIDLLFPENLAEKQAQLKQLNFTGYFISSHTGAGLPALLDELVKQAQEWKKEELT